MKRVAILGCGPTGLLVAHAAEQAGLHAKVYSVKEKSEIPGSQHLHGPVPGLTSLYPEGTIQFVRLGTARDYAEKVYGDPDRNTGWENYFQVYPSWNAPAAYDKLWDMWEERIEDTPYLDGRSGDWYRWLTEEYDLVVATIPAQSMCRNSKHQFNSSRYYIIPLPTPPGDEKSEIVVYNGLPQDKWYRWSILGGLCSIESTNEFWYGDHPNVIEGFKAHSTDCDCYPAIPRLGRWAEWRHGVTMYTAYTRARELFNGLN